MMALLIVQNATRGSEIANRIELADRFTTRLLGLMGRRRLESEGGLLLTRTPSIHTFFMKIPIDVVYLDREGRVLRTERRMPPGRIGPRVRGTVYVLELPPGRLEVRPCTPGDRLAWRPQEVERRP